MIIISPHIFEGAKMNTTSHFFEAIKSGDLKTIQSAIAQSPALVEMVNQQKSTPILIATMHQHYEIIQYLLDAGVDINRQDNMSLNPFLWGCINNDLKVVKMMVNSGKVDLTRLTRFGGNGIVPAAEKGHLEIVQYLLENTDINPNCTNNLGWTALIEAIILNDGGERQQRIIELLLMHGADPNMVDAYGKTPLTLAKEKGYLAIAEILLNHGGL